MFFFVFDFIFVLLQRHSKKKNDNRNFVYEIKQQI